MIHPAGCPVWSTYELSSCTCDYPRPWRIRKSPEPSRFPWQVQRHIASAVGGVDTYERLMSCSSFTAAVQLVESMLWLAAGGVPRDTGGEPRHVR